MFLYSQELSIINLNHKTHVSQVDERKLYGSSYPMNSVKLVSHFKDHERIN